MDIINLIPLHNRLRNPNKIKFFTEDYKKPIQLSLIDGNYYIHDGHHRLVFEFCRGRYSLDDSWFNIAEFSTDEYNEVNFDRGYYTPFDVKTECRVPDFFWYKDVIKTMLSVKDEVKGKVFTSIGGDIESSIMEEHNDYMIRKTVHRFIARTKHKYTEPRAVYTLKDLAMNYLRGCYEVH